MKKSQTPDSGVSSEAVFKTLKEAERFFSSLKPPFPPELQQAIRTRLEGTARPRYLAFRLLVRLLAGDKAKQLSPWSQTLQQTLSANKEFVDLTIMDDTDSVRTWVKAQFAHIKTKEEAHAFLEQDRHLWVLFQILRARRNGRYFAAGFAAYTDCLEGICRTGKKKYNLPKEGDPENSFVELLRHLGKKIGPKPTRVTQLLEVLKVSREWTLVPSQLTEELERTNNAAQQLQDQKGVIARELEATRSSLKEERARVAQLTAALQQAEHGVARHEQALNLQAGLHQTALSGAITQAIADLRRYFLPALEDIRLYANREAPNKEAILRKVEELESFLKEYRGNRQ